MVVTGCDSGFGFDLVVVLAKRYKDDEVCPIPIAFCHHANNISRLPKECVGATLDITNEESVMSLRLFVYELLDNNPGSELVGLVNNAGGLITSGPLEWTSVGADIRQMDLNYFGTVRITKALLPLLRKSKGRIVNVSSLMGVVAAPLGASYSASKFALEGWSDALRREMLPFGVTVHVIEPGMVKSTHFYQKYLLYVQEAWESTCEKIQCAYGQKYKDYCTIRLGTLLDLFASRSTNNVVNAMMHALTSQWPKHRYRVGWDSRILGAILEWLPDSLADLALTVCDPFLAMTKRILPVMPASCESSGWVLLHTAMLRYQQRWILILVVSAGVMYMFLPLVFQCKSIIS